MITLPKMFPLGDFLSSLWWNLCILLFFLKTKPIHSTCFFFFLKPNLFSSYSKSNPCSGWVGDPLPWTMLASLHPQVSGSSVLLCWFNAAETDCSGSEDSAAQSRGWLWLLTTTALVRWVAKSKLIQILQVWTVWFWLCSRGNELLAMAWLCCCPCLEGPLKTLCWTWCLPWAAMGTLPPRRWRGTPRDGAWFDTAPALQGSGVTSLCTDLFSSNENVTRQKWPFFFFYYHDKIYYLFLIKTAWCIV